MLSNCFWYQKQNLCHNFPVKIVTVLEMKLKLWQTQIEEDSFMHFDISAKHNPTNNEIFQENT